MQGRHSLLDTERATAARLAPLNLDLSASHAMLSIYRAANSARGYLTNGVLRPHGLTWTGFLVLWVLWIWERMEARHVAESVGITKATLSGVTDTLERRGLVVRVRSTEDRRLVYLELTPDGTALLDELYPEFNRAEAKLTQDLGATDLRHLTDTLRRIVTFIEDIDLEERPTSAG